MSRFSIAFVACTMQAAHADHPERANDLGVVTIRGGQPTSLPTQIPATMEGVTREQIDRSVNAMDSEDALKYFPSLLVRKRYIGDYNHAVLSSRASGTGNSARSAVYADGILLSNYLGNGVGGLTYPPRWGLVTPEEIDRVDAMYGPFSAAYPGNSVGAVVVYVTRMPTQLEGSAKVGYVVQPFSLYGSEATYRSWQASANLGSRTGDWAWWFNLDRTDSQGQPLSFALRPVAGRTAVPGTPVTGAVNDRNPAGAPIDYIGSQSQYHTVQDHAKIKLAYDFSAVWRATYTLGLWRNTSTGRSASYLQDADGAQVASGPVSINGANYAAITGADFPLTNESLSHRVDAVALKSRTHGNWDWEFSASRYRYARDDKRQNAAGNPLPAALTGGPGTLADGSGTGWHTLSARGSWRPAGAGGDHVLDFGLQDDAYQLRYSSFDIAQDWLTGAPGRTISEVAGRTRLQSFWAQEVWHFAPRWKAVLGARAEQWQASEGLTRIPGASPSLDVAWPERREEHISPKFSLSWQWLPDTVVKGSLGRAVRFPTVGELYGATSTANAQYINDPGLHPERSWSGELSLEHELGAGLLRLTAFGEETRDALYSQGTLDAAASRVITRVANVGRVLTTGAEAAYSSSDVGVRGLDLNASLTFAHSRIVDNAGFASVPGDTIGKWQPNVPAWRATLLATYAVAPSWTVSAGARYSGRQYRTLDNSDVNGETYMGVSRFFVIDLRARWKVDKALTVAAGIDNVNNDRYWNFHPYPQRSYVLELKRDL